MAGTVLFEAHDALVVVTLAQPGRFNAMSRAMWQQLRGGFEQLASDGSV